MEENIQEIITSDFGTPPTPPPPPEFKVNFENYLNLWFKFNMMEVFLSKIIADKQYSQEEITAFTEKAKSISIARCKFMFPGYDIQFQESQKPPEQPQSAPA